MSIFVLLPFVFLLFYLAGAGAEAFIGATFLLVPFAKEALSFGISTPLFFLLSGVVMGTIKNNTSSLLLREVFEISTLFLAYAASYEFTSALKKHPLSLISRRVLIEFIVVPLPFVIFFSLIGLNLITSFVLSLLFLSISPITSMILLYETPIEENFRESIEGGIIIRDGLQILLLIVVAHFAFHGTEGASEGLVMALLIAPLIGGFLAIGNNIGKRGTYLFLPVGIVLALLLEMYFGISSVFLMVFAGFWERIFIRKSHSTFTVIEMGKILYPFIYTYTGQLIITFSLSAFVIGSLALMIKLLSEYFAAILSKCKLKKVDISVKVPMAGLSLHHLLFFKSEITDFVFSLVAFVLIASEFLAPLLLSSLRNVKEKI